MTRMPAPIADDIPRTPAQATSPSYRCKQTTDHNGTEPNPRVHKKPMSSHNKVHTPSGHPDRAPSQGHPNWETTHFHNRERLTIGRKNRGPDYRCNKDWCDANCWHSQSNGRG